MLRKRDKMARMKEDQQAFLASLQERKSRIYEEKMADWQKLFQQAKKDRLEVRRVEREEKRRKHYEEESKRLEEERIREEKRRREFSDPFPPFSKDFSQHFRHFLLDASH